MSPSDPVLNGIKTPELRKAVSIGSPIRLADAPYEGVRLINVRWGYPEDDDTLLDHYTDKILKDIAQKLLCSGIRLDIPCISKYYVKYNLLYWIVEYIACSWHFSFVASQAGLTEDEFTSLIYMDQSIHLDPDWVELSIISIRWVLADMLGLDKSLLQPYRSQDNTIQPIFIDCTYL